MYAQQWLEAHRAGNVIHDWTTITTNDGNGRTAKLRVSADAPRIAYPDGKRIRHSAGAYASEQLAQVLGGHMLTAKLVEQRHVQASVIMQPLVSSIIKNGGTVGNTTDAEHSAAIDERLDNPPNFTEYGAAFTQVRLGDWLISNTGKQFVLDAKCSSTVAVNHGWMVHESATILKDGFRWWKGIEVYPAVSLPGWHVIQLRGGKHGFGPTGQDQDDYSQFPLFVHRDAWVSDIGDISTASLYTEADLCSLVTHDGVPVPARHPSVPSVIPDISLNTAASHPERAVAWMHKQMRNGVAEQPMGSNNGPEIRQWLERAERDGQPTFGKWLASVGGNWCVVSACEAYRATRIEGDAPRPHKYRASGVELMQDASSNGAWFPAHDQTYEPAIGDMMVLPRGEPGSGLTHTCLISNLSGYIYPDGQDEIITIGGNESNRFKTTRRKRSDALGFVSSTQRREPIALALDVPDPMLDGDNATAADIA